MDHPALFASVKARNIEQLHNVLGPTLKAFGAYRVVYWEHAYDGILTSLGAIPGIQGYDCLCWAERVVREAHEHREAPEADIAHAEYVFRLRAKLLGKALERITDFDPAQRPDIRQSIAARVAALGDDITEVCLLNKPWLLEIQSLVAE